MASTTATGKRKEPPTPVPVPDEEDILKITPLGAGNEVGRSCILLEYKGKTVMLDCGLHPAYSGLAALPFFDNIDPSTIDVLLVSHFHLDHAASLPYFLEKAIYKWLLSDYVKVSNLAAEDMLYTEQDLLRSYEKIEVVDYHQEVDVEGIKFTSFNAGHVLGAAMFLIEIAGVRVLYTGDYSREEDRHLMAAERPRNVVPEVLISESTYGVQSHQPRQEREAMFTSWVHRIVQRGGRCLIPVFALGRAQELLLILDEYWQAHSELHNVPIYYASSLAKKCMTVYQTYTNMMNERIRRQVKISNPFQFKHISNLKSMQHFDDVGPCVMMASPGMLQSGLSRELLELWCVDKRNGVIIPGYVVEGTLAKQILSQPEEIVSMSGAKLPLRLSVEYISFSAHVDYQQNSQFIDEVAAPNLVLVHGDSNEMGRLRAALQSKFHEREAEGAKVTKIYTPRNCETVELYFRGEKMAKLVGSLAAHPPKPGQPLSGVLVSRDFQYHIMAPQDLQEFTDLHTTHLQQVQSVPCRAPFHLVQWHLEMMYGFVEVLEEGSIKVFDTVIVTDSGSGILTLEWEGNAINDMVADSILAIIIQAESSPASVKATKSSHSHHHHHHKEDTAKVTSDPSVLKVDDLLSKSDKSKPATPVDESSPTAASLSKAEDLVKVKKEEVEAAYDPYTQSASAEEGNADVKVSKVEGEGVEDTKGEEEIHVDGVKIKKEPEDEETKVNPPVSASFSDAEQEEKQEEDEESGGDGKGVKDSGDDKFLPSHDPQVEGVALKKAQPNTNEKEIEHDHDHTEETLEEEREFAFYATGFLRNHFGDDGVELVGGLGARNSEGDSATEKAAQRQQQQQHQHSQKDRLRSEAIRFSKTRPRAHVWIVRTDRETAVLVLEKEKLMVAAGVYISSLVSEHVVGRVAERLTSVADDDTDDRRLRISDKQQRQTENIITASMATPNCTLSPQSADLAALTSLGGTWIGIALTLSILTGANAVLKCIERPTIFWKIFLFGAMADLLKNIFLVAFLPHSSTFCGNVRLSQNLFFLNGLFFQLALHVPTVVRIWRFFLTQVTPSNGKKDPIRLGILSICGLLFLGDFIIIIVRIAHFSATYSLTDIEEIRKRALSPAFSTHIPRVLTSIGLLMSIFAEVMFVRNFMTTRVLAEFSKNDSAVRRGVLLFAWMVVVDVFFTLNTWADIIFRFGDARKFRTSNPTLFGYGFLLNFMSMAVLSFDFWASERIISEYIPLLVKLRMSSVNKSGGGGTGGAFSLQVHGHSGLGSTHGSSMTLTGSRY